MNGCCPISTPFCSPTGCSASGPISTTSSSKSGSCFSQNSTLQLASGDLIYISNAAVGDVVLVSSRDGKRFSYQPIVFIPHGPNLVETIFLVIATQTRKSIHVTPDHLVLGGKCGTTFDVTAASSLNISDCVRTIDGDETIVSINKFLSQGVYTVVTQSADDLLVVNQIVASPFAGNHEVANAFYNIIRSVNKFIPSISNFSMLRKVVSLFGDIAVSF